MNVGAVSAGYAGPAATPRERAPALAETAKLLGMSSPELVQQIQSGASLDAIAASRGVSRGELTKSIESDLSSGAAPAGVRGGAESTSKAAASRSADGAGAPKGSGGAGKAGGGGKAGAGGGGSGSKILEELAEAEEAAEQLELRTGYNQKGVSAPAASSGAARFDQYA